MRIELIEQSWRNNPDDKKALNTSSIINVLCIDTTGSPVMRWSEIQPWDSYYTRKVMDMLVADDDDDDDDITCRKS